MAMIEENMYPTGEELNHIPFEECQCHPKKIERSGNVYLFHYSKDHREIVYAVEMLLGFRCEHHGHYVDRNETMCTHTKLPDRYYEYPHPKQ